MATDFKQYKPMDTPENCERGNTLVSNKIKYHDPNSPISSVTKYEAEDCEHILEGDWWVVEERRNKYGKQTIYRTYDGYILEEYSKKGKLTGQLLLGRDFKPLEDVRNWVNKEWWENGKLSFRSKTNSVIENEESVDLLKNEIENSGEDLLVAEAFDNQGRKKWEVTYILKNGEVYRLFNRFNKDGSKKDSLCTNLDSLPCEI